MLNQPLVTILVPSYNHGRYLRARILSILCQTYSNFELIVIDDSSEDDSDQIIRQLKSEYCFEYIRNCSNSGTPFCAWEIIGDLAHGKYIWICESDDIAEPTFLETAVCRLEENRRAVLFYSNSLVINESGEIIGHTETYFRDIWRDSRWTQDFSACGLDELDNYQLRGQTVPNMSSALIATAAFKRAYDPFLKRLRLTGDWLFIGKVLRQGDVEFCSAALSRFRKHDVTARVRVKSARSQAEFILTKYHLFRAVGGRVSEFAPLMGSDVIRFLYETARWWEVVGSLMQISFVGTIRCGVLLFVSTAKNPEYFDKFKLRYRHACIWRKENA